MLTNKYLCIKKLIGSYEYMAPEKKVKNLHRCFQHKITKKYFLLYTDDVECFNVTV